MPTGYTAQIQKENFNLKTWLKRDISRAFGMLACLRDEQSNLTDKEILKKLEENVKNVGSYHKEKLKEIEEIQKKKKDWEKERLEEINKIKKEIEEDNIKTKQGRKKYSNVLSKLKEALPKVKGTIAENIIKFGIEQIEQSMDFDYPIGDNYFENKLNKIIENPEYRFAKEEELLESKIYHTTELLKEENREKNRLEQYKEYIKIIDEAI